MINWLSLLTNSIWLIALSAALAVAGTASWQAAQNKTRFRDVLRRPGFSLALLGCQALFCLGVALSVQAAWEKAAWAVLTLLAGIQLAAGYRKAINTDTPGRSD